jgi:hypothetical protein
VTKHAKLRTTKLLKSTPKKPVKRQGRQVFLRIVVSKGTGVGSMGRGRRLPGTIRRVVPMARMILVVDEAVHGWREM